MSTIGNSFGLYLGVNLLLCVLSSSVFVGRIGTGDYGKTYVDLVVRVFFGALFITPTIFSLYKTGQLGSEGEHLIRDFMKVNAEKVKGKFEEYNYAINFFALKLRCGEVGLRMYDFPMTYKMITKIFSLWASFLGLIYTMSSRQ